jgi:hypothetical protein
MEHEAVSFEAQKLRLPFFAQISGASHSGKSHFVADLVLNRGYMMDHPVAKVVWLYAAHQKLYEVIAKFDPGIEFRRGLDFDHEKEKLPPLPGQDKPQHTLLVVDDLAGTALETDWFKDLASVYTHHSHISVLFITQRLFSSEKYSKQVNDQCSYLTIFRSPRDETSVGVVATQSFKNCRKFMLGSFEHATDEPYEYLFVDLTAQCPKRFRLRSRVVRRHPYMYLPKTARKK